MYDGTLDLMTTKVNACKDLKVRTDSSDQQDKGSQAIDCRLNTHVSAERLRGADYYRL